MALVATEQRLETMLSQAQVEAGSLVRAAQESARQRLAAVEAELAAATDKMDVAMAAERRSGEERVAATAQREADRYASVDDREVARLAGRVLALLVAPSETT